ncbi:hypothetical protein Q428_05460 [Fervidicella metallireducens AeB]|uniref:Uncharacterized protein n=1 Tax=Fervidicella metallireducens AeB TaxID=1403537 RepID=A0A017RW23_9CLOT|nr:hypothetical protein [Fervidicella metallireducens]EYE88887.1 hypothetical protein Q428_05460 [Fervidicella metallireducens AeB]
MHKNRGLFYDYGKNNLYDSWELVRLYGLYDDDKPTVEPEGNLYKEIEITPWEGRMTRINTEE